MIDDLVRAQPGGFDQVNKFLIQAVSEALDATQTRSFVAILLSVSVSVVSWCLRGVEEALPQGGGVLQPRIPSRPGYLAKRPLCLHLCGEDGTRLMHVDELLATHPEVRCRCLSGSDGEQIAHDPYRILIPSTHAYSCLHSFQAPVCHESMFASDYLEGSPYSCLRV